ncbi:MAG: 6-phosphogluconolactonase [Scrofimicrobium sp.]
MSTRIDIHPDADAVAAAAAAQLVTEVIDRQSRTSQVHLVLTGGTVGIKILERVAASAAASAIDWNGVHIWWGDERFLPEGDPERNETQAREALLSRLGDALPVANVHYVPRPGQSGIETPDDAARAYAAELAEFADEGEEVPSFDVLLLGVGPDGHVASLFPGNSALRASGTTVGVYDSPKPPPQRVSLTFGAINNARNVWLVVAGEEKAVAVASAWSGASAEQTPAGHVHGVDETLWIVDTAASQELR